MDETRLYDLEQRMRGVEGTLVRCEEAIKGLMPFERVRQMLDPLEQSIDSTKEALQTIASEVKRLVDQIGLLAESDKRLTASHDALMEQRARDEKDIANLEKRRLEEEIARLRKTPNVVLWIKDTVTPITGLVIVLLSILGVLIGFLFWLIKTARP
jgi:chromosome segregation ATPase